VEVGSSLLENHMVEAQDACLAQILPCPLEARENEVEVGRVCGGAKGGVVYSDVSESSSQDSEEKEVDLKSKKKNKVKKKHNHSRPQVPPPGTPTFKKLAMAMEASGKRRKAAGQLKPGNQPPSQPIPMAEDVPGIDLHVALPMPRSGIDDLIDDDGEVVPDSALMLGGGFINEEEVTVLMGIQQQVGFSFQNNEHEIHSRLVELEVTDRRQNVEVEQGRGDQ
jgi:hypothetical protein